MKITILKDNLKTGLNIIERVASKSLTLPILNSVLLKVSKNFLIFSATDLEIGINYRCLIKAEKEGEVAVPVKIFSNFISSLQDKELDLQIINKILHIKGKNCKTQIKCFDTKDFPIIPKIETEKIIEVNNSVFEQGISQVIDFCSQSQTRVELSGVFFTFQKDRIKIVTTDSFRLAEKIIYLKEPITSLKKTDDQYSFILPQKAAREFVNIFSEKEGNIRICLTLNQVLFEYLLKEFSPHPQLQLISRLIEGEYPNYQEIIPKKFKTQAVFLRDDLLSQIKAASFFSGKTNEVKLKFDPKKQNLEIFSESTEVGENNSHLSGKINGEKTETSFNYKFLIDGITNIKSKELIFELNGEDGPAVLKPVGDDSYLYVIMPIKI